MFELPPHYIRHSDTFEYECAEKVEYDMDEQDHYWLELVNTQRQHEGFPRVSPDEFEFIIDTLEKEWFLLTKDLVKPETEIATNPEDSVCAVCEDAECDNSNAIVFCDGCNLSVHQDCYGIPYIPEGQWLCRKCMLNPNSKVNCVLCPNKGGAFKKTTNNRWAHLVCALWIPEASIINHVYMEPIDYERIPKARKRLTCTICKLREMGACIQCCVPTCFTSFHVTCARKENYMMIMKNMDPSTIKVYCKRHAPVSDPTAVTNSHANNTKEKSELVNNETIASNEVIEENLRSETPESPVPAALAKPARLFKRCNEPPIVVNHIADRVYLALKDHIFTRKQQFAKQVFKYWALKREVHRGAPLLKRLHLEPWTAFSTALESEAFKKEKFQALKYLRNDLERLRLLTEQVKRREKFKRQQCELLKQFLVSTLFPLEYLAKKLIEQLQLLDVQSMFSEPVDLQLVPDYLTVITKPMAFQTILANLSSYSSMTQIKEDILLIFQNAMIYNKPDTRYYKAAVKLKDHLETLYPKFEGLWNCFIEQHNGYFPNIDINQIFHFTVADEEMLALLDQQSAAMASPVEPEITTEDSKKRKKAIAQTKEEDQSQLDESHEEGDAEQVLSSRRRPKHHGSSVKVERPQRHRNEKKYIDYTITAYFKTKREGKDIEERGEEEEEEDEPPKKIRKIRINQQERMPEVESLTHGTLVWAKMKSFPWYPAEIFIPGMPHEMQPSEYVLKLKRSKDQFLVLFFETTKRSWCWCTLDCLRELGKNLEYDQQILENQSYKTIRMKSEVLDAYQFATQTIK